MSYEPSEAQRREHRHSADEFVRLLALMQELRGPGGCPWDREQTLESLRPYLIEEAFEVLDAIDRKNDDDHREELGDLLLQIVFHAELARESNRWTMADVARGIVDKLHFRHPHVFGDTEARSASEALKNWETMKAEEKKAQGKERRSVLDGVPKTAPALLRAERVGDKAASAGFDWPDRAGVRAKVAEELDELDRAIEGGDPDEIEGEIGDLLFAVVSLARWVKVHPEDALRGTIRRFVSRYQHVERALEEEGRTPADADPAELDRLWEQAKRKAS